MEWWNFGMVEYWNNGRLEWWNIGRLTKLRISLFQYSIIPSFPTSSVGENFKCRIKKIKS
jgi:hypothetical protein